MRTELSLARVELADTYLTVAEVAERLKVNDDTVRRLFLDEPGVIILYHPRRPLYHRSRCPKKLPHLRRLRLCHRHHPSRRTFYEYGNDGRGGKRIGLSADGGVRFQVQGFKFMESDS